jgi:NDP-sugar pyrophosphorylase family protein
MNSTPQQTKPSTFEQKSLGHIQAVILCGGLGTRLSGALAGLPKALAPVGGRPFLDYVLANLASAGVREIVMCTGYRSESIEGEYGADARTGLSVVYSAESVPMGTAGALKRAAPLIYSDPFLVLNGDSFLALDFCKLLAHHRAAQATATLALARVASADRYGAVTLDTNGKIRSFLEKRESAQVPATAGALINAGIYVFDRTVLGLIPPPPPAVSLERQILPALIGRGLFGFASDAFFIDIGIPEDYALAQTEIPRRANRDHSYSR